jgi:hypothetical protein
VSIFYHGYNHPSKWINEAHALEENSDLEKCLEKSANRITKLSNKKRKHL